MTAENWWHAIQRWWQPAKPRTRQQRRDFTPAAIIGYVQPLEQRQLLANVVDVRVSQNQVALTDLESRSATAGDSFDVTYTSSQITLTAKTGTELRVDGTTKTTHTINLTAPVRLFVAVDAPGNTINITGDNTARLTGIEVRFGNTSANNSVTLSKVRADSVTVIGQRANTAVTIKESTINGPVTAKLRNHSTGMGSLTVEQSTVNGATSVEGQRFTATQATFAGPVAVKQKENNSSFTTTASTYNQALTTVQGSNGTININASADGANKFLGTEVFKARKGNRSTMNVATDGATNATAPRLVNIDSKTVTAPTAPTVDAATVSESPKTVTGTWDSTNAKTLKVTAGDKTYTLGTDSQLTSPTTGKWSLDLSAVTLPAGDNTITATNTDTRGSSSRGTGVIKVNAPVDQQQVIQTFLTANQLTATKTASGLNYVVQTQGTGATPTDGQTLSVNYTGFLLNSDGTQGTKFDSNVDPQFNHVQPFTFPLGQGRVIAGWDEAFKLLPVGSVAKLIIPSALAYGTTGNSNIPPDSILIFDVTLISAT